MERLHCICIPNPIAKIAIDECHFMYLQKIKN